jgi:hypothetical protein
MNGSTERSLNQQVARNARALKNVEKRLPGPRNPNTGTVNKGLLVFAVDEDGSISSNWRTSGPPVRGLRFSHLRERRSQFCVALISERENLSFGDLRRPLKCSICQIMTAKKEICVQSALV